MTTTYITLNSIQEFQDIASKLGDKGVEMMQTSIYRALNDRTVAARMKQELAPMSTPRRYGRTYDKNGKEVKKKFSQRSVTKQKASGQSGNLRRSFILTPKGIDEVSIGFTASYAGYVHDAKKPVEGDYWEPGKKGGWTTKGTGPRFVDKVLKDNADHVSELIIARMDDLLKENGII